MPSNEQQMLQIVALVERGCVEASVLSMRLIHRGTVTRFGSSPGTPVVTGEHRGSGRTSLHSPPIYVAPSNAPVYPIWGDNDIDASFSSARLGDQFFWGSNAPVPSLLEEGWSKQAPTGFLGHSIREAKRIVETTEFTR